MNKLAVFVLTTLLMVQPIQAGANAPSNWAEAGVTKVLDAGLIHVERFDSFNEPITREAYGYLIYQLYEHLAGNPIMLKAAFNASHTFTDTEDLYLQGLKAAGLVTGYPDGSYKPSDYISREEIMTLYVRLLESLSFELVPSDHVFSDEARISGWAYESVKKCYASGLVQGKGKNIIDPKGYATVEESLVVLARILDSNQFIAKPMTLEVEPGAMVSDGRLTYGVRYDVFGQGVGIDAYEDFTLLASVYDGNLNYDGLFLNEGVLYFFDSANRLMMLDESITFSGFMLAHVIDDWSIREGKIYYRVKDNWFGYDFRNAISVEGVDPRETIALKLVDGQLFDDQKILDQQVIDYAIGGNKVYYLRQDGHLLGYNRLDQTSKDYGVTQGISVDIQWNFLIIKVEVINGSTITRFMPIFSLEDYL